VGNTDLLIKWNVCHQFHRNPQTKAEKHQFHITKSTRY